MPSDTTAVQAPVTDANEIPHARQVLVLALTTLAEQREADSESHILRVQNYVLAQTLSKQPKFAELLTPGLYRHPVPERTAVRHGLHWHPRPHPAQARPPDAR
jgi:hypothetical protein